MFNWSMEVKRKYGVAISIKIGGLQANNVEALPFHTFKQFH